MIMLELLEPREDEGVRESQVKQFAIVFLDKRQAVPHFFIPFIWRKYDSAWYIQILRIFHYSMFKYSN